MAQIATAGLWHLGCVVSAGLASLGHTVRATDTNAQTVRELQQGEPPLYEPGLPELIAEQMKLERLAFVTTAREALQGADFVFLTSDTPVDENDRCDVSPLEMFLEQIARHARPDATVVVMSQVPVGTCRRFAERLHHLAPRASFSLVCQPENLRLGQALAAFLQPDFLLVGADDESAGRRLLRLYEAMDAQQVLVSRNSAEMAKHMLNAFLATSISFVNEMAALSEVCGADVRDVVRALRLDRRIGKHAFLSPGPGFSGGTLGRDLQTLRGLGALNNQATPQLDATVAVNDSRMAALIEKLRRECGSLSGSRIGLLGLTYKPGTSTLRRSRSIELARMLISAGAAIQAFDPRVSVEQEETRGIALCADAYQAAKDADSLVVMNESPEFQDLDLNQLHHAMRRPVLLDAHNCLDVSAARAAGFRYFGVGIPVQMETRAEIGGGARS